VLRRSRGARHGESPRAVSASIRSPTLRAAGLATDTDLTLIISPPAPAPERARAVTPVPLPKRAGICQAESGF